MKNIRFYTAPAILLCWCLFSIMGCKDPVIQSKTLLTKGDTLAVAKDTLALNINTIPQNNLVSTGVVDGMLGSLNDRNFGITYGSFYAQYSLITLSPTYGANPIVDSVVLSLAFDGSYGPCTKPMNISVFELNQVLSSSATYYTSSSFQVKTPPIGYLANYIPDFIDSVNVYAGGGNQAPQLRVNLSKSFGLRLLTADSTILTTDSSFQSLFKGIYVTASGGVGNGIIFCNLSSQLSAITVYYKTSDQGDSIENPVLFPLSGVYVNHFDNNYAGSPVYQALHTTNGSSQKIYLQGGGGTEAKIQIAMDSLNKYKNQGIGINKAELIIPQSQIDSQYAAPSSLSLLRIDDAGIGQTLDDASASNYGGTLQADTIGNTTVYRYHFNISVYMQKLFQGIYNNNGLYLTIPGPNSTPSRIVLNNPPASDKIHRTYLTVTFTKF